MKKLKLAFTAFLAFSAVNFSFGQNISNLVKITAKNSSEKNALRVYEVERAEEKTGNFKFTTIEYMIENKTNRVMEGEFEFSLRDGESVTGYALDINGKMRQGVVVEKDKARQVFEEKTREGVDPGLVEMTAGNNFKARVYPINASGVRHIQITVKSKIDDTELTKSEKNEVYSKIYTQTEGKDTYFYFCNEVNEKNSGKPENQNKKNKKLTVFFDVSASGKNRDISKEALFIKKYAESDFEEIEIVSFCNEVINRRNFVKKNESTEEIESYIKKLTFDGATDLNLDLSKISEGKVIIVSDGIANWKNEAVSISSKVPVFTVSSSSSGDFGLLKRIAGENKGTFVNLAELSVDEALSKMNENPLRVLKVEYNQTEIKDVYPLPGTFVENNLCVSGILVKKSGKIKITLGRNGVAEKVIEKTVSAVDSEDSIRVKQIWATDKIDQLSENYSSNKIEIVELSKKFGIVTKETTLLVLDTAWDYVRYGIEPPEELKEECRKYQNANTVKNRSEGIPAEVFRFFESYKAWWTDYKKVENNKPVPGRPIFRSSNSLNGAPLASSRASAARDDVVFEDEAVMVMTEAVAAPMAANSKMKSTDENPEKSGSATISIQAWNGKSKYIAVLKKTPSEKMYEKYLELRKDYENSPSFYMEVSDYFADEGFKAEAVRILSNLAELNLENTDMLRTLGYKLTEKGEYELAIPVFRKLVKLRPEVPQYLRDLALACKNSGKNQEAVESLWKIASTSWDSRYSQIQQTALNDMNAIINAADKNSLDTSFIDKNLMMNFDMDLRVVLTWNTDDCDVDLWVTDPDGEKCYYGHNRTQAGGRLSRDFTQGYGPEEFAVKKALKGVYKIQADYYGNHQQKVLQPVSVQAEVYTNWGRPNQKCEILTLTLADVKDTYLVGTVEIK